MCHRKRNEISFQLCRLHRPSTALLQTATIGALTFTFDIPTNNKMFANIPIVPNMQNGSLNSNKAWAALHICYASMPPFTMSGYALCTHWEFGRVFFNLLSLQGLFDSAIAFCAKYKYQAKRTIELHLSISRNFGHRVISCLKRRKYERRPHLFRFSYVVMELFRCNSQHFDLPASVQVIC